MKHYLNKTKEMGMRNGRGRKKEKREEEKEEGRIKMIQKMNINNPDRIFFNILIDLCLGNMSF